MGLRGPKPEIDTQAVRALRAAGVLWKVIEHQLGASERGMRLALAREAAAAKTLPVSVVDTSAAAEEAFAMHAQTTRSAVVSAFAAAQTAPARASLDRLRAAPPAPAQPAASQSLPAEVKRDLAETNDGGGGSVVDAFRARYAGLINPRALPAARATLLGG